MRDHSVLSFSCEWSPINDNLKNECIRIYFRVVHLFLGLCSTKVESVTCVIKKGETSFSCILLFCIPPTLSGSGIYILRQHPVRRDLYTIC